MQVLERVGREERCFAAEGRTLLRVRYPVAKGESAAEQHVRALCAALLDFAERELYPAASAELAALRAVGRGFAFSPHRYEITLKASPVRGHIAVKLHTVYRRAGAESERRVLHMRWSADGAVQYARGIMRFL
jgi:hypothetical protein